MSAPKARASEAKVTAPKKKDNRSWSGVTKQRRAFIGNVGDARSDWYRRRRDLINGHVHDLGGSEMLSVAQISLCQRVASIEVACELMEGLMSRGSEVDIDVYTRTASHLRRMLETLGLGRVQKDVTTTIREYLDAPPLARAPESNGAAEATPAPRLHRRAEGLPEQSVKAIAVEIAGQMRRGPSGGALP